MEESGATQASTVEKIKQILKTEREKIRQELAVVDAQLHTLESVYIDLGDLEKIIDLARRFDRGELGPVPRADIPNPNEGE